MLKTIQYTCVTLNSDEYRINLLVGCGLEGIEGDFDLYRI